jgi:hypothetical protein
VPRVWQYCSGLVSDINGLGPSKPDILSFHCLLARLRDGGGPFIFQFSSYRLLNLFPSALVLLCQSHTSIRYCIAGYTLIDCFPFRGKRASRKECVRFGTLTCFDRCPVLQLKRRPHQLVRRQFLGTRLYGRTSHNKSQPLPSSTFVPFQHQTQRTAGPVALASSIQQPIIADATTTTKQLSDPPRHSSLSSSLIFYTKRTTKHLSPSTKPTIPTSPTSSLQRPPKRPQPNTNPQDVSIHNTSSPRRWLPSPPQDSLLTLPQRCVSLKHFLNINNVTPFPA